MIKAKQQSNSVKRFIGLIIIEGLMIDKLRRMNNSRNRKCILHVTNKSMNQTEKSGSAVLGKVFCRWPNRHALLLLLMTSFVFLGSCNEKSASFDLSQKPDDYEAMSALEKMRYGRAIQSELHKDMKAMTKLNAQDLDVVLPEPDLTRQDGREFMAQYRTEDCVMDVFWKKGKNIHHYEVRQRRSVLNGAQEVIDPVAWQCVQQIMGNA